MFFNGLISASRCSLDPVAPPSLSKMHHKCVLSLLARPGIKGVLC